MNIWKWTEISDNESLVFGALPSPFSRPHPCPCPSALLENIWKVFVILDIKYIIIYTKN